MESSLWPLVIFHIVVGIVGLPGNALIILVYTRKRQALSPHVFILALAVADFIVCLFTPVTVYHLFYRLNYTSNFLCRFVFTVTFATVFNSCFLTSAIAVDRYQAICRPHRRWMTTRHAKLAAVLCLVLAIVHTVPVLFSYDVERREGSETGICTFSSTAPKWVKTVMFIMIYVAPFSTLFINTILYGKIYFAIRKQAAVRSGQIASVAGRNPNTELGGATRNGVLTVSHRQPQPDMNIPSTSNQPNTFRSSVVVGAHHKQPPQNNAAAPATGNANEDALGAPVRPTGRRPAEAGNLRNKKTTKMLLITTLVYFSTWFLGLGLGLLSIPIQTQNYIHQQAPIGSAFLYLFSFVFYINNAINPFIYGVVNRRFVLDCKKTVKALRCKGI